MEKKDCQILFSQFEVLMTQFQQELEQMNRSIAHTNRVCNNMAERMHNQKKMLGCAPSYTNPLLANQQRDRSLIIIGVVCDRMDAVCY